MVILDLGIGKDKVDATKARTHDLGNKFIRAPEAFSYEEIKDGLEDKNYYDGKDHPKADLYSIGANLIHLLCPVPFEKLPGFFHLDSEDIIKERIEGKLNEINDPVQIFLRKVLFGMIGINKNKRISVEKLVKKLKSSDVVIDLVK